MKETSALQKIAIVNRWSIGVGICYCQETDQPEYPHDHHQADEQKLQEAKSCLGRIVQH